MVEATSAKWRDICERCQHGFDPEVRRLHLRRGGRRVCAYGCTSKAPTSHIVPPVSGRGSPRWSVVNGALSASTQSTAGMWSIATLPAPSACVVVGSPLLASSPRFSSPPAGDRRSGRASRPVIARAWCDSRGGKWGLAGTYSPSTQASTFHGIPRDMSGRHPTSRDPMWLMSSNLPRCVRAASLSTQGRYNCIISKSDSARWYMRTSSMSPSR